MATKLQQQPKSKAKPKPALKAKPKPALKAKPEPKVKAKAKAKVKAIPAPKAKSKPALKAKAKAKADQKSAPKKKTEEVEESSEESATEGPVIDALGATIKKILAKGKERGFVTCDELNEALPQDQFTSEQIEDLMAQLNEMGVSVVENEETEDGSSPAAAGSTDAEKAPATKTTARSDDEYGRTDDPVRMYLREMGSVELLSREGEIEIAKRIEAGREEMIGGICESPLTLAALTEWRDALKSEDLLLRDIIDLDATYGGGPGQTAQNNQNNPNNPNNPNHPNHPNNPNNPNNPN
ncbi:MAG: RNA polymerase sigma factor region1.1 domain-containing protein, partial [Alphaproteobacteria bacterium]